MVDFGGEGGSESNASGMHCNNATTRSAEVVLLYKHKHAVVVRIGGQR